jgi:hypothetical protein
MKKTLSTLLTLLVTMTSLHIGFVHADGLDVDQMKGMKKECMDKEHDNKKCHNEVMKKCEESKSKKECTKMMKKVHKEMSKEKSEY